MIDAHEQEQDRKIRKNAEAINQVADYLHEIRDHFEPISAFVEKVPPKWKASMRLVRTIIGFGAVAAVLIKGGVWYYQKQVIHEMAERYIRVASDLYYGENNADVAMPFVRKWLEGLTPNPCVECNPGFKFRVLAEWATVWAVPASLRGITHRLWNVMAGNT